MIPRDAPSIAERIDRQSGLLRRTSQLRGGGLGRGGGPHKQSRGDRVRPASRAGVAPVPIERINSISRGAQDENNKSDKIPVARVDSGPTAGEGGQRNLIRLREGFVVAAEKYTGSVGGRGKRARPEKNRRGQESKDARGRVYVAAAAAMKEDVRQKAVRRFTLYARRPSARTRLLAAGDRAARRFMRFSFAVSSVCAFILLACMRREVMS